MKKMYIRITSIFLLLLFCLTALPIAIFADSVVIEDIETSRIEDDLQRLQAYNSLEGKEYYKDTTVDYCEILDFIEYGYNYWGYTDEYALYLYLYNPSGKEIDVSTVLKNRIQLRVAPTNEKDAGGGSEWEKVGLKFLDSTDDFVIYKFKVEVPRSYMPADKQRNYEISDIEITFVNERLRSVGSGGKWIYTGYMEGRGPNNPLSWVSSNLLTVELELHQASWKTETSAKGPGWQQELSSVYFSVPDKIIKDYGDKNDLTKGLVEVKGVYDHYKIDGLSTDSEELYELFSQYAGLPASKDVPFAFFGNNYSYNLINAPWYAVLGSEANYELSFYKNAYLGTKDGISNSSLESQIRSLIDRGDFFYKYPGMGLHENEKFIVSAAQGDLSSQIVSLAKEYGDWSFWHGLMGIPIYDKEKEYTGIAPIQFVDKLDTNALTQETNEEFAKKYFVDESYVSDIKSFTNENENTFIIRFAITDYFIEDIYVTRKGKDEAFENGNYYFQKDIFLNFDILSLTWENENGVRTVLPVTATPIDIFGSITPPPLQGIDKWFSGVTNIFNNVSDAWDTLTSLRPIIIFAGILAIIAIIAFLPGVAKAVWIVISAPFKLAGKAISGTAGFIERRTDKHYERKEQRDKRKRDKRDYDEDVRRYEENKKTDEERYKERRSEYFYSEMEDRRRYEEKKAQEKKDRAEDKRRYEESKEAFERDPHNYKKFK